MNPAPLFSAPLGTPADIVRLREHVDVHKDLGYVFAAITRTQHGLRGEVPLVGFCGAPCTLFSSMIEGGGSKTLRKAKTWLFKYPQESTALLTCIADICIDFLVGQVDAGAQVSSTNGPCSALHLELHIATASVRLVGRRAFPTRFRGVRNSAPPAHRHIRSHSPFGESFSQQRRLVTMFSASTGALSQRTCAQRHRRQHFKEILIPTGYMADARRSRMASVTRVQHFV
jgi:hypothetical protein